MGSECKLVFAAPKKLFCAHNINVVATIHYFFICAPFFMSRAAETLTSLRKEGKKRNLFKKHVWKHHSCESLQQLSRHVSTTAMNSFQSLTVKQRTVICTLQPPLSSLTHTYAEILPNEKVAGWIVSRSLSVLNASRSSSTALAGW